MTKIYKPYNKKIIPALFLFLIILLLPGFLYDGRCRAYQRESAVVQAVNKVSPAVVNISSEYEIRKRVNPFSGFGMDPRLDSFFRDFFDPGYEQRYKRSSLGSGVIIDGQRGFILTNAHVIANSGKITVVLKDEREFEAQIVGADQDSDLSVLRITSKDPLPAVEMGDSNDLMIGETVIAIGNPFGFSNTVTTGVVSAVKRSITAEDTVYHDFIQTDASINPGNSGGPLLNINGDLIGINTAIFASAQGIGFAIPINKAKRIVSDLIQYGEVIPAWVGIIVQDLDSRLAGYLKLPGNTGAIVKLVENNSPAWSAGIKDGDILMAVGTTKIHSSRDYYNQLKNHASGDTIKMHILRNGKEITVSVKASVYPMEQAKALAYSLIGVQVEDLSKLNRLRFRTIAKEGVVITEIKDESYMARIGVKPGDIIRQMDEITIHNTQDFEKAIVKYRRKSSMVILVQRGGQGYYITVKL